MKPVRISRQAKTSPAFKEKKRKSARAKIRGELPANFFLFSQMSLYFITQCKESSLRAELHAKRFAVVFLIN